MKNKVFRVKETSVMVSLVSSLEPGVNSEISEFETNQQVVVKITTCIKELEISEVIQDLANRLKTKPSLINDTVRYCIDRILTEHKVKLENPTKRPSDQELETCGINSLV